jgi:hypothetical protein
MLIAEPDGIDFSMLTSPIEGDKFSIVGGIDKRSV